MSKSRNIDNRKERRKERNKLFKVRHEYFKKYYGKPDTIIVDATFIDDSGIFIKAKDVKNWNHVRPYDPNWQFKIASYDWEFE